MSKNALMTVQKDLGNSPSSFDPSFSSFSNIISKLLLQIIFPLAGGD
jgi:hypothetical protein